MKNYWTAATSTAMTNTLTNIAFPNTTTAGSYWIQTPFCSCHEKRTVRELIQELRVRLKEEREVALEAKELIAELQHLQRTQELPESLGIGLNPHEGGLP